MILEAAFLKIKAGKAQEFESAFRDASPIIAGMKGYISHKLNRCIEVENTYLLLVQWQTLEDHTVGFRESSQYQEWRRLLHHFYEPGLKVEHYSPVELA